LLFDQNLLLSMVSGAPNCERRAITSAPIVRVHGLIELHHLLLVQLLLLKSLLCCAHVELLFVYEVGGEIAIRQGSLLHTEAAGSWGISAIVHHHLALGTISHDRREVLV
jgi:hypothetical protein